MQHNTQSASPNDLCPIVILRACQTCVSRCLMSSGRPSDKTDMSCAQLASMHFCSKAGRRRMARLVGRDCPGCDGFGCCRASVSACNVASTENELTMSSLAQLTTKYCRPFAVTHQQSHRGGNIEDTCHRHAPAAWSWIIAQYMAKLILVKSDNTSVCQVYGAEGVRVLTCCSLVQVSVDTRGSSAKVVFGRRLQRYLL